MLPFHLEYAHQQRAENSFHQSRLGRAARIMESRRNGPLAFRASQSGRRKWPLLHGLLHAKRYSIPVCAGGIIHTLRRIFLLRNGADLAEPDVLNDRHHRSRRTVAEGRSHATPCLPADSHGKLIRNACRMRASVGRCTSRKTITNATWWNFSKFPAGAGKLSGLYKRGMVRGQEGQFEYDAINDKLPTVSWIIPTSFQSEHPDYMPADGAAFVASKIDAIAANPDVWAKTFSF